MSKKKHNNSNNEEQELETKSGKTVLTFTVPLTGEHKMEAVSGECRDESIVRRVNAPNPAYLFRKQAVVFRIDPEGMDIIRDPGPDRVIVSRGQLHIAETHIERLGERLDHEQQKAEDERHDK